MGGSGSDPQSDQRQQSLLYSKGAEVEVSSDEDGFRGAFYRATVTEDCPKPTPKRRKKVLVEYHTLVTDDGHTFLKEYVDLAYIRPLPPQDYDGGDDRVFEENDVVDAGYRDGWWTGIVRKVLEGSRFRVFFENPPDVIEFDGRDLRPHFAWVNGNWVRPPKQPTLGSIFSSGTTVEVNLENRMVRNAWFPAVVIKENGDNTFLVVYQSSKNIDEAERVKANVDFLRIRPSPPCFADRNYELLETVDIRYDFGWRAGVITKVLCGRKYLVFLNQGDKDKELDHSEIRPHVEWVDGKWISESKTAMFFSNNQEQLGDAVDGIYNPEVAVQLEGSGVAKDNTEEKTPCFSGKTNVMETSTECNANSAFYALTSSNIKVKHVARNGNGMQSHPSKNSTKGDAAEAPLSVTALRIGKKRSMETIIGETLHKLATPKSAAQGTRYSKKILAGDQPSAKTGIKEVGKQHKVELECQEVHTAKKRGRPAKSPFKSPQASVAVKETDAVDASAQDIKESEDKMKEAEKPLIIGLEAKGVKSSHHNHQSQQSDVKRLKNGIDQKKNSMDLAGEKIMEFCKQKSSRRKSGRPRKLVVASSSVSEDGKEEHVAGDVANDMGAQDHTTKEVDLTMRTGTESTVTQDAATKKTTEVSKTDCRLNMADVDDQPISMWFGGVSSSMNGIPSGRSTDRLKEARERQVNLAVECVAVDTNVESIPDKNIFLPIAQRSPVWKAIESMEVFRLLPQKPHFLPLAECKEEYREGSAIGIMVTFASLVEKISSLQFDNPRSLFESILESLLDLEKHGFDVNLPLGRVTEMLSIKDGQKDILNESKGVERQLMEHIDKRRKLNEKIKDMERKIAELQEEFAASKAEMESKELEISRLQSCVDAVNTCINEARSNFEKVATAPWKLP